MLCPQFAHVFLEEKNLRLVVIERCPDVVNLSKKVHFGFVHKPRREVTCWTKRCAAFFGKSCRKDWIRRRWVSTLSTLSTFG
jgi:hypothetical protein